RRYRCRFLGTILCPAPASVVITRYVYSEPFLIGRFGSSGCGNTGMQPYMTAVDWRAEQMGWQQNTTVFITLSRKKKHAVAAPPRDAIPTQQLSRCVYVNTK
ncbi:unnamed protein product, partial [Pylaiella littoralis]